MTQYTSKYKGHTIVLEPIKVNKENGIIKRTEGKRIIFRDGQYRTNDPKIISFLDEYVRKYPSDVTKITTVDVKVINKVKQALKDDEEIIVRPKRRKRTRKSTDDLFGDDS